MYYEILFAYLIFINIFALLITAIDKISAIKRKKRIRETTLLLISVLGGSVTMFLTMLIIRHKTRHPKFMIGIPAIIIAQFIACALVWEFI